MDKVVVYYQSVEEDNQVFYYTLKIAKKNKQIVRKYPKKSDDHRYYELMSGYTTDEAGLRQYLSDLIKWADELKNHDDFKMRCFDFFEITNPRIPHIAYVQRYIKKHVEQFDPIDDNEYRYLESAKNRGIIYFDRSESEYDLYSYDFKGYFPECMTMIKIPYRTGQHTTLKKLPKVLEYGYYHVNITISDKMKKLFIPNEKNIYTHYAVEYARILKKKFGVEHVSIKLIKQQNNAYIYDADDLIDGKALFGKWYAQIKEWKEYYPKNRIVKLLSSSVWGFLCGKVKHYFTIDEPRFSELLEDGTPKYYLINELNTKNGVRYEVYDKQNPYRYKIARMKSFLCSYAVMRLGLTIMDKIDDVVRVQVDGISFKTPQVFNEPNLVPEDKLTGHVKFKLQGNGKPNINTYHNTTNGYKTASYKE